MQAKHHFSIKREYSRSSNTPWPNCVTNVLPNAHKLTTKERVLIKRHEINEVLATCILSQRCKPEGLCYSPMAGTI